MFQLTLSGGALLLLLGYAAENSLHSLPVPGSPPPKSTAPILPLVQPVNAPVPVTITPQSVVLPPPRLPLPRQRTRRSLNQIYEFEHIPLGNRIPVILVPGRAEEFQNNSWWRLVHRYSRRDASFRHRFKLYVFLYNSKEELDIQAQGLDRELRKHFGHLPRKQPLMLVTYSLGGVITREVLASPSLLERVDTVVALAVPFHGSPIFDPDWFSDYLNPPNRFPIRRFWDRLIYRAYMFNRSNLTRGLKWDNFDGSKPQFRLNGLDLAGDQARSRIPAYVEYPNADAIREKTITYASYLENGYTHTNQPPNPLKLPRYVWESKLVILPGKVLTSVLPVYGFTVHSVFTYMNFQLANLPTYTPEDPQGKNSHLYRFNDGAIPLSSMLFLKPRQQPYSEEFDALVQQASVRKVRIFANLDHTHLGEYAVLKERLRRPDVIHPQDGQHLPSEWILFDLQQRLDELRKNELRNASPPL